MSGGAVSNAAQSGGGFGLRLHIEHLRIEGMAPMMAEQLAGQIEAHLLRLVEAYGAPPAFTGGGALRLDAASVRVQPGWSQDQVAAAVARQLYEQWYGPLGPWAGAMPDPGPQVATPPREETRR